MYIYRYVSIYTYREREREEEEMYAEVKEVKRLVHAVVEAVQDYNMHRLLQSVCIFWRSCTTRLCRGRARALAGSWQQRHASLHAHAALCTSAVTLTRRSRRASSNKRPIRRWSMLRRTVSLARCPGRLLMTSRGIQQPTRPSHHTTQSNKPPIPADVYIYSRRASFPAIRTETRSAKRASHAAPAASYSHLHRRGHKRTHCSLLSPTSTCLRRSDKHE